MAMPVTATLPAKTVCLVLYRPGAAWLDDSARDMSLLAHGRFLAGLVRAGKVLQAGPYTEPGGAAIFDSDCAADVREIVGRDPAVRAQLFEFEIREWRQLDWNLINSR